MATYTITPRDYQYLQAMLNHEAQNTITNDLNRGNTNSAYGQMIGLVETWLNRAMARGTDLPTQMLAPAQLSFFNANSVPGEAAGLDPRITQMLNTYLHSRDGGDPGSLGSVNQYLNRDVTDALYSQGYRDWYNRSQLLGAFGDPRSGGRSSLQQEFLNNPAWQVPEYDVRVSPDIRLNPTEGDVNALDDFRNSFRLPTPLPPARPDTGVAGIEPRTQDPGLAGSFDDLRNIWNQVQTGATTVSDTALNFLRNTFGGDQGGTGSMPTDPPAAMTDGFGNTNVSKGVGPGSLNPTLTSFGPAPGDYSFTGLNPSGGVGNGSLNPTLSPFGPAPSDYAFSGLDPSRGVGNGTVGQLPPGFSEEAYLRANPDLVQGLAGTGVTPAQHYLRFGASEGRAIGPSGLTPTLDTATTIPTLTGPSTTAPTLTNTGTAAPTLDTATTVPTLSPTVTTPTLGGAKGVPTLGPDVTAPTIGTGNTVPTLTGGTTVPTLDTSITVPTLTGGTTVPTLTTGTTVPTLDTGTTAPTLTGGTTVPTRGGGDLVPNISNGTVVPTQGPTDVSTLGPTTVPTLGPTTTQVATDATPTVTPPLVTPGASGGKGGVPDLPIVNVGTMGPGATAPTLTVGTTVPTLAPTTTAGTLPPGFNEQAYLQANPDLVAPLAAMHMSGAEHYLRAGMAEGRTIGAPGLTPLTPYTGMNVTTQGPPALTPTLDTATTVPTLAPDTTVTATDGGIAFDPAAYLQANPDVAAAHMNPFQHFVLSGFNEGRALNPQGQTFGASTPGFLTFDLPSLTQGLDSGFSQQLMNNFGISTGGSSGGNGGAGISNPYGFSGMDVSGFNPNMGGGSSATTTASGAPRSRISSEAFFRAQQASRDWFDQAARPAAALNYNVNNQQLGQITPVAPNLTLGNYNTGQMLVGGGLLGAGGTVNHNAGPSFLGGGFGTTWL
jgi:hypothetical protein